MKAQVIGQVKKLELPAYASEFGIRDGQKNLVGDRFPSGIGPFARFNDLKLLGCHEGPQRQKKGPEEGLARDFAAFFYNLKKSSDSYSRSCMPRGRSLSEASGGKGLV
jgi:hypothetical protein